MNAAEGRFTDLMDLKKAMKTRDAIQTDERLHLYPIMS